MNPGWLVVGTVLELAGAGWLVWSAYRTRRRIKNIPDSWDAELAVKLRDAMAGQAHDQLFGFTALVVGVAIQLMQQFSR
jgi:threonine/homoserine/homoserine lactone efflux protein